MWSEPSFVPLILIVISNIITGIFLVKKQCWFSIFIIIYGVYLVYTSKNYDFIFEVIELYGAYLIVHFSLCSLYVFIKRKKATASS
jgi:drug/metabolite transporter (DMT)-like permease